MAPCLSVSRSRESRSARRRKLSSQPSEHRADPQVGVVLGIVGVAVSVCCCDPSACPISELKQTFTVERDKNHAIRSAAGAAAPSSELLPSGFREPRSEYLSLRQRVTVRMRYAR